jgi:hypothetical protein
MALLAGGAARRESVTIDEVAHIGAGVSYLQKLDMRMNPEHPPLAKMLAALPVVVRGAHVEYSHLSWTFSGKIFRQLLGEWVFGHWLLMTWNDPHSTLLLARLPMLLVTLLLGFVLCHIGSQLGGRWGGLLCLTAFATTPAFLAFGPLVLTDTVVALFWVLTVWQLPGLWHSPSRGRIFAFGVTLAGALLSKFSSGLLFFVFLAVVLSLRIRPLPEEPADKGRRRSWRRQAWQNMAKGTLWAALVVYLVYLILSWNQPTDWFSLVPHFPASPLLRRLLMPVGQYTLGLAAFAVSASSRPTFILGHFYPHGVWFYFPTLFLLKSQSAFLLLLLLACGVALFLKRGSMAPSPIPPGKELHWRCLWISLMVFVAACMMNRLDLSIRHFSIALALVILLLAPLPRMLESLRGSNPRIARVGAGLAWVLAAASIVTAIRAYPNYFPFLNVLSMNRPGYQLVNDSNLDWNHALPEVENFVSRHRLKDVLIDEYGFSDPTVYVPQAQFWNCQSPGPSDGGHWAAVSANMVQESHNCLWLLQYPHHDLAGGSMLVFELPATIPQAGTRGGPPLPAAYHNFAGFPFPEDGRLTFLRCIRQPEQLQPTLDHLMAMAQEYQKKQQQQRMK